MIIYCTNTAQGLKPNYDDDFDEKKKLKIGETYKVEIKKARNYELHKKYFALINCAWEFLNEKQTAFFKENIELFRKTVEISAGHCDMIYSIERKEWIEQAKSISFEKMGEFEFRELYEAVKRVLFSVFLINISVEEFEMNLINF